MQGLAGYRAEGAAAAPNFALFCKRYNITSMQLYKIEKGIKLPRPSLTVSNGKPSIAVATMALLKKGESFLVKDPLEAIKAGKRMRDLNARQRESGEKRVYASRRVAAGVRFWRVK